MPNLQKELKPRFKAGDIVVSRRLIPQVECLDDGVNYDLLADTRLLIVEVRPVRVRTGTISVNSFRYRAQEVGDIGDSYDLTQTQIHDFRIEPSA